ncbi:uncharacterized protein LOC121294800 [Polyodon spathula]|uniref:uncharacterized protein LOC121294800 n=1 Tax=Polyodon spathula TaxID=7913 RepID=UPI001B7E005C|nr:uncharacterized protein LOC121294800 [Polyodon spathula]
MDVSKIRWSSTEYSLKEFVYKFQDSFPKIVKVTEGFLGRQELDSISSSTLLRVHALYSQERALVESKSGKVLSLPTKLTSMTFFIINHSGAREGPFTLLEILKAFTLPVKIQPTTALTFQESSSHHSPGQNLDSLTFIQSYQESFLLGHCLNNKGTLLEQVPLVLPMYMKQVRLVLAKGLEGENEEQWEATCNIYNDRIRELGHMDHFIFQGITLLDNKDLIAPQTLYAEIEPIYMDLKKQGDAFNLHYSLGEPVSPRQVPAWPLTLKPQIPAKPQALPKSISPLQVPQCRTYRSLAEVPQDLHSLSVREVCDCLLLLNLGSYMQAFRQEQIDGDLLYELDHIHMRNTLGMSSLHITKLLRFRQGWRPRVGLDTDV